MAAAAVVVADDDAAGVGVDGVAEPQQLSRTVGGVAVEKGFGLS